MQIFYHSKDADGKCSGAIVKYFYPEAVTIPMDYCGSLPNDIDETVYMVDFSLPIEEMLELDKKCNLIWIDHHKTIIEEAKEHEFRGKCILDTEYAACELVAKHILDLNKKPEYLFQYNEAIHLLGRYDIWDHNDNWDNRILPFQMGLRLENMDVEIGYKDKMILNPNWILIFEGSWDIEQTIANGNIVLKYQKQSNKLAYKTLFFETEFVGYKCDVMNKGLSNSLLFSESDYPIHITFYRKKNLWTVSLYSDTIDVGAIAKKFGGGGHKGAAGFTCKELPFEI